MRRVPSSPFTVSVDREGHALYQLAMTLTNLPTPRSLGPYSTYVAWATSPSVTDPIKLGEVRNGLNIAGIIGLNRFIVTVDGRTLCSADETNRAPAAQWHVRR